MSNVSQGAAFEKEVEQILSLKGYKITRNNLINGTQIDLHATKNDPLDKVSLVVECADRDAAIGVDLLKQKASVLLSLQGEQSFYRLMFVSRTGFSAEARAFADSQSNISIFTLNELENLLVDLTPYVNSYIYNYERSLGMFKDADLFKNYIGLSARDEKRKHILSLDKYVRSWLREEENNLLFLLGDYGAGKTSFSRQLAYELLKEKYVGNAAEALIPIVINLRDNRGKFDLRRVVTDSLVTLYGVELTSFAAFERLCSTGKILVILDGFDEMSDRSDAQTLTDSFNQIYLFAALNAKVLLTCRSNFFRNHNGVIELLKSFSITIPVSDESKLLELSLKDQGKVLYVEKLSEAQIGEFVAKRFGDKSDLMLATIKRIHDLSDLSTRPVLLDMIVSTLPELESAKRRINSAALYEHYTDRWTTRDQWRVSIPLRIRQSFCEVLGWEMHCANVSGIPFELLEKVMVSTLGPMADNAEQLDRFKNDIQTCSFLVRTGDDDEFRFAHKSFREFFVARKLVADLVGGLRVEKTDTSKWLVDRQKTQLVFEGPYVFAPYPGAGKASTVEYFRNAVNDRMRSSPVFLSLLEAEVALTWNEISSDASVHSHFETEIRGMFTKHWLSSFSGEAGISEEIATFAIEHLSNLNVEFEDVVTKITVDTSFDVLCDLLRLADAPDWVQQNVDGLKKYVAEGSNANLRIACAGTLTKYPGLIDGQFIRAARGSLSVEGWSYVLFELASNSEKFGPLLADLFEHENLSSVDQVICVYGLGGTLPQDEKNEKMASLVGQLLRSDVEKERSLALKVCNSLSPEKRVAVVAQAFKEADSTELKKALTGVLEELAAPDSWQIFRGLAAQEKDPIVRGMLRQTEEALRTVSSKRQNRSGWSRVTGKRAIRDDLWSRRK
jgi:hypothetical protein